MRVLLTGGMGFIGSHTAVSLLEAGHEPILYDNLSNADRSVVDRIGRITGHTPTFIEGDIRDGALLKQVLRNEHIEAVIHFAGLKAVGESVGKPLEYFDNNVSGTIKLLEAMRSVGVKRLIFSSSSTVYGTPQHLPLTEAEPTGEATNPYGRTKIHIEEILADLCRSDSEWSVVCLRYFNPIGAHPSGLIGEDPNGTGVRDFIHVVDLAQGHTDALPYAVSHTGWIAVNLGCGRGYSVLEVVKAFEDASGRRIPLHFAPRRAGDIAANWCDPTLALKLFGWKAKFDIEDMCRDSWHFESLLKTECETR